MSELTTVLIILILYVAITILIIHICMNGDSIYNVTHNTKLYRLHQFIGIKLPKYILNRILPERIRKYIESLKYSICEHFEKYIFPFAYPIILFFTISLSYYRFSRNLKYFNTIVEFNHLLILYTLLGMGSWFLVFLVNPGYIVKENVDCYLNVYKPDGLIFKNDFKKCYTCHTRKPARSSHCRLCDKCIARFDHHCPWMGTCIGMYNLRYFLFFLFFNSFMLFHGCYISWIICINNMNELIIGKYSNRYTGQIIDQFSWAIIFKRVPDVVVVGACYFLAGLIILMFGLWTFWNVARGVTTNEDAKWDVYKDREKEYAKGKEGNSIWDDFRKECHSSNIRERVERGEDELNISLMKFNKDGYPLHLYNNGIMQNILEVLFPYKFYRDQQESNSR